jgi:hypothetical protein
MYHQRFICSLSDDKSPIIVMYGQEVQGSKKSEISIQIQNAQIGEVIHFIIFLIFGLQEFGTSILKYFQYQK